MKQIIRVLFGLLAVLAATGPSQAVYSNASLKGCYGYLEHTTDVPNHFSATPPLVGKGAEAVGVACFNGIGGAGGVGADYYQIVVNGITAPLHPPLSGSYTIAASALGTAIIPVLGHYGLALNSFLGANAVVPAGVAPSFQFMKIAPSPVVPELIIGGTAYYQQPNPGGPYTTAVLDGCYSMLEEGVSFAPTPAHNGKDQLGRWCFNGSTAVTQKVWSDVNGIVTTSSITGTYAMDLAPYYGMGTFTFGTRQFAFVVNNVGATVPGVASGFQFTQIGDVPVSNIKMTGGAAFLQ